MKAALAHLQAAIARLSGARKTEAQKIITSLTTLIHKLGG